MDQHDSVSDTWTFGERPVHVVGLIGFSSAEENAIRRTVELSTAGGIRWRIGPFGDADAWIVHGATTSLEPDGQLAIRCGDDDAARTVRLLPHDTSRPIAYSLPITAAGFEPSHFFSSDDPNALLFVLAQFAMALRPQALQMYLVASFLRWRPYLDRARVFHVERGGRLLAVVDLRGECGVAPHANAADLADAQWLQRPDGAAFVPPGFVRATTRELVWQYASRTHLQLLPRRFLRGRFYLRRSPLMHPKLCSDSQLLVLRELAAGRNTIAQLRAATGLVGTQIAHDLGALYVVGCVTSDAHQAQAPATADHADPTIRMLPWWLASDSGFGEVGRLDLALQAA